MIRKRNKDGRIEKVNFGNCSECEQPARSKGLCAKHYRNAWQRANPEKRRQQYLRDYAKNKKRFKAASMAWSKTNPDKANALTAKWRKNNPDKITATKLAWNAANPEKVRAMDSAKQARRLGADGRHTALEVKALFEKQRGCCAICSDALTNKYHKDHIQPISSGGNNYITNIQLLCPPCNQTKGARDPIEFMQSRGFLL